MLEKGIKNGYVAIKHLKTKKWGGGVSPCRLKIFFAYKRNKANLDPFHMCFTISL